MRQASLEPAWNMSPAPVRPACTAWPVGMGRSGQRPGAGLRARPDAHRPRFRRAGAPVGALSRGLPRRGRTRPFRLAGQSRVLHRAAVRGGHGHADRAPEAGAAGVGRHVDGGLIGMALSGSAVFSRAAAAMRPHPGMPSAQEGLRFDRMVLNDVGPGWSSARWPASASTWACRASSIPSSRRSRRCAPIRCRSGRTATSNGRSWPATSIPSRTGAGSALRPGAGAAAGRADPAGTGGGRAAVVAMLCGHGLPGADRARRTVRFADNRHRGRNASAQSAGARS